MATTDSRTGFRLPWSTDRAASREASAEPADELVAADSSTIDDTATPLTPEPGDSSDQEPAGDGVRGQEEVLVTTLAPDAALAPAAAAPTAPEAPGSWPAGAAPASAPAAPTAARRPTKFLADLTRAMQAAAEQARTATLDQYRADGTAVIEQIHARSATGATELRHRADDDVAAIKDWSKAEIARIREETEARVSARREQLEGQLERHAAIIEHEIERVRGRIASFEGEMGRFFDELLGEDDPAVFAARAANLPEPPSFEDLDADAIAALLEEPGVGVPAGAVETTAGSEADAATTAQAMTPAEGVEVEAGAAADVEPATAADVPAPADVDPWTGVAYAADAAAADDATDATLVTAVTTSVEDATEAGTVDAAAEAAPLDREAAMAAIQAAAEAAASLEAAEAQADRAEAAADRAEAAAPPVDGETAPSADEGETTAEAAAVASEPEPELDPRLAMLGLTPDFAAAEMAAAEAAAADVDEVPEIGDDALAARLSGLVPGDVPAAGGETVTTQVVVTGLVSVASIASFKRHVGRLAGVAHVGVSSGPDGEFLFSVEHAAETSLRDLIPTLPGFGARVVGAGDGILHVSAQDPQD